MINARVAKARTTRLHRACAARAGQARTADVISCRWKVKHAIGMLGSEGGSQRMKIIMEHG